MNIKTKKNKVIQLRVDDNMLKFIDSMDMLKRSEAVRLMIIRFMERNNFKREESPVLTDCQTYP